MISVPQSYVYGSPYGASAGLVPIQATPSQLSHAAALAAATNQFYEYQVNMTVFFCPTKDHFFSKIIKFPFHSKMQLQLQLLPHIKDNIRLPVMNIHIQQQPQVVCLFEAIEFDLIEYENKTFEFCWLFRSRSKLHDTIHIHATPIGRHSSSRCSCQWHAFAVSRTGRIITRGKTSMISETLITVLNCLGL